VAGAILWTSQTERIALAAGHPTAYRPAMTKPASRRGNEDAILRQPSGCSTPSTGTLVGTSLREAVQPRVQIFEGIGESDTGARRTRASAVRCAVSAPETFSAGQGSTRGATLIPARRRSAFPRDRRRRWMQPRPRSTRSIQMGGAADPGQDTPREQFLPASTSSGRHHAC